MARPRNKSGNRAPPFVNLRYDLLDQPDYIGLSHKSKALLVDVMRQYNGRNNGDFCLTLSVMRCRGWTSNDTLRGAISELIEAQLLVLTRQGGRNKVNLYGVTWLPIHECKGKLDVQSSTVPIRKLSAEKNCIPADGKAYTGKRTSEK